MRMFGIGLALCLIAGGQQKASLPVVEMVVPGVFAKLGGIYRSGGGWIGLTPTRDGFGWEKYRLVVKGNSIQLEPPVVDAPLFLLRGLPGLAAKPVHTCFDRSETGSLQEQNPILLTCEAEAYRVEVSNAKQSGTASLLRFWHRGVTQTLYRWPTGLGDQNAELIWAGDLDGDDKVDLLVDHGAVALYLSSRALKGQLVGRVASFNGRR